MTRLHPFTLLTLAAGLTTLAWLLPAPAGGAATAAAALALATVRGVRRALLPAVITAAPFWLFLLLLHDWATTVAIGLRLTTMTASFVWLAAALPPPRLVEAMVGAGWGAGVAYLFAATLSAVPLFKARAQRILEAQRCRGVSPRGGIASRFRALRAVALPLMLSVLHEVDERALALETRGLAAGTRRTPLDPPRDRLGERVARWGMVGLCLAAGVWRVA